MIAKRGRADIKPFRQTGYVDFNERTSIDRMLQDELAGGVMEVDRLDAAVRVDDVQLVGDGVRIEIGRAHV